MSSKPPIPNSKTTVASNVPKKKSNPVSPTGQLRSPSRAPSGNTGISQAKMLVKSILDQVTLNDSPPVNDFLLTKTSSDITSTLSYNSNAQQSLADTTITSQSGKYKQASYSRQQHIQILPTIQSPSVNDTHSNIMEPSPTAADGGDSFALLNSPSFANSHISKSSTPHLPSMGSSPLPTSVSIKTPTRKNHLPFPPPLPNSQVNAASNSVGHGAEVYMGNLSLAQLCIRTMESIPDHNGKMPNLPKRESNPLLLAESKDSMSSWQRDVEMAPTFATDEERKEDQDKNDGASKRKQFLDSLDDDQVLFPDANMSMDHTSEEALLELTNTISELEEEGVEDREDMVRNVSKTDGVVLSTVEEEEVEQKEALHTDILPHPMNQNPDLLAPSSSFSPNSMSNNTKLTMSPDKPPMMPRMQMFGSEYARHLSSESPFSPIVMKAKNRSFPKRKKRVSSSAAAVSMVGPQSELEQIAPNESVIMNSSMKTDNTNMTRKNSNMSVSTMSNASIADSVTLEEAPTEILSSAITDIVVTHGNEKPPKGYYRISQTSSGTEINSLKSSSGGGLGKKKSNGVFLNVKKEPKWDRAVQRPCVTALTVIFPDRNEFVPPGYCVVRRYTHDSSGKKSRKEDKEDDDHGSSSFPANLNYGTHGERVYLCYRRSREGNPITGLIPLHPSNNEPIPEGYTVLERSPRNFVADINSKAGPSIFLAFRQRLANLETLRPLTLVLSVHYSQARQINEKKRKPKLKAYYCTGGTVVPADVGNYHIMDRSTHPLISPSSVSNRLSLIQASRIKNSSSSVNGDKSNDGKKYDDSSTSDRESLANGLVGESSQGPSTESPNAELSLQYSNSFKSEEKSTVAGDTELESASEVTSDQPKNESLMNNILNIVNQISPKYGNEEKSVEGEDRSKSIIVGDIVVESDVQSQTSEAYSKPENNEGGGSIASNARNNIFAMREETDLEACYDAMAFIPLIESPIDTMGKVDQKNVEMLLQTRIAVITPILTACYTHHGGSSLLAVEGLHKLLKDTDFFLPDVARYDDPSSNQRLTLLDLSIQVVCDVANSTSRETNFLPCIEFVVEASHYARGNLNARTIGYMMRFYLFVFYFGASIPTASSWPKNKTTGYSRKEGLDEANDVQLLSEEELELQADGRHKGYVPGGAPQAAALALKELISIFISRLRKMKQGGRKEVDAPSSPNASINDFVRDYVESLVDGASHQVDVSNYTQLALHQIHRSGGSELFWHDMMTSCGRGLFGSDDGSTAASKDYFITSFAILASIVKISSGKVRKLSESSEFVPRDIASKLLSLEMLHHYIAQWGKTCKFNHMLESKSGKGGVSLKNSTSIATMAYGIRRLVIPCLLSNTRSGLDDIKVFRRMMRIVTELWCNPLIRKHLKIEIGVLIEHFVLKFLRLGPQVLPPKRLSKTSSSTIDDLTVSLLPQQVCIVSEMKTWFSAEPRDILELFMNFDQVDAQNKTNFNLLPSTHWKITQQMVGAVCTLAEQCTDIVSDQIRLTRIDLGEVDSQSVGTHPSLQHTEDDLREMALVREGARYLQEKCFDTISQISRSLMLCAAASSGASYNLLSKLREKQEKENARKQGPADDDDSSKGSGGNMTVKSVSTIGNIVGGIMNKNKDTASHAGGFRIPESPRAQRQIPQLTLGEDDGDGIVEYWQTSIAAERRKNMNPSPRELNDSGSKPPRRGWNSKGVPSTPTRLANTSNFRGSSPLAAKSPRQDDMSIMSFAEESLRGDPQTNQKFEDTLNTAFEIMESKSLKKALEYLVACSLLTPSPRDIATFLRLYQTRIDTAVLGDYLGEGGKDGDEVEHYNLIRFYYTSAISFVGMNVEQGLRHFLTNCGFRLPGEAQKIDRIMTTFSQCYWEDNAGDHGRCPFQDQDTVFLIAFAIIMLNTDLHKQSMFAAPPGQSKSKQKQRKKMTKQEFLNNLRGVGHSEDLSKEYLSNIYDSIEKNSIAIYKAPESHSFLDGARGKKTIKFATGETGHIIKGNLDLAGMVRHIIKSVKPSQELLRGLSAHEHPYLTIKNKKKKKTRRHMVPEELVRAAFSSLWHHFHGTINSALDAAHLDPKGLENCLDVLMYCLCTTICLDMTVERNAFTSQLVRVKFFRENRGLEEEEEDKESRPSKRIRDHLDYKNDPWYVRIEKAAESYNENAKITALDEVDNMFKKLHASLKVDSTLKQEMIRIARRIRNGQILLNDPTRYFLREGELKKRCNRSGRNIEYTFFLFSDVLIYSHKSGGMYKIHGELPLHRMKINELHGAKQKKSFHIIHPRKSFIVTAQTTVDKDMWQSIINTAIHREVQRKARIEGARQNSAAYER